MSQSASSKKTQGAPRKRGVSVSTSARAVTKFEGRVYTHRIVWRVAEDAAKRASRNRRNSHARVVAGVFSAFTLEAYLNLLIEHVSPTIYADERNFFSKGRFAGTKGKLRWVEKQLGARAQGELARHRNDLLAALRLRDKLAHAKPISYALEIEHDAATEADWLTDQWIDEMTSPERTKAYCDAIAKYVEWLHTHGRSHFTDPHLKGEALRGALQAETGSSSLKGTSTSG